MFEFDGIKCSILFYTQINKQKYNHTSVWKSIYLKNPSVLLILYPSKMYFCEKICQAARMVGNIYCKVSKSK